MTPVSISRPDLLRRVGAIVRWRPVAFLLGVAVAAVAFSLYLDVAARAKVPADLQAAARSQGTVTVSVNLGFPPEEFHLQELQAYGIVTSVEGNTVNLSDVSATELHALARRYWVGTIEAMGLFALGTGFRPTPAGRCPIPHHLSHPYREDDMTADMRKAALDAVDGNALADLTAELIDIPSPVGSEQPAAEYLAERFERAGLETLVQEIEPGRANVIGRLRGNGDGHHLLYMGHLDTTWSGSEEGIRDLGPGFQPQARREGDWIIGMGAYNMKSGLASMVHAVEAIATAQPEGLAGDLIIAGVAGETCHAQVGSYIGPRYRGTGVGAQFLSHNGVTADLAVIAEPTSGLIDITTGGLMLFEVLSQSPPQATYKRPSDGDVPRPPDALEKALAIADAVRAWAPGFLERNRFRGQDLCNVTLLGIEGGHPWRPSKTAVHCRTYFEISIMPGMRQVDIEREFRAVVQDVTVRGEAAVERVSLVHNVPGAESGTTDAVVDSLKSAHQRVHNAETKAVAEAWYCDSTPLTRNGVPTLIYGPGGRSIDGVANKYSTKGESCYVPDLVQGSRVFVEFAYDFCNTPLGEQPA